VVWRHLEKPHVLAQPLAPLDNDTWPILRVDLVGVRFIYEKEEGTTPFALGI
jgi:hypothetical protein